jgi:2-dehydropantoate 2-reductase
MRTLIFGAGAIGGYLGAILTAAGRDVTLVARGAHYEALASRGIHLEGPKSGRAQPIRVNVCRQGQEKPPYDLVFVALKAHQIASVAKHLCSLVGRDGLLLFGQNGVPWWYFERLNSPFKGRRLSALDPEGVLAAAFPIERVIGGMYFKPSHVVEPGRIRLVDSAEDALTIGELDNSRSERLERIAELVAPAGWPVRITTDIRAAKWGKLLSNAIWNPLSAITQGTAKALASFPGTSTLAATMIAEVIAVAASVGVKLDADPYATVAAAAQRVAIPSSTLQDVRAGRALEIDALVKAVIEIGQLTGVATPTLSVVGACAAFVNQRIIEDGVAIAPYALNAATL